MMQGEQAAPRMTFAQLRRGLVVLFKLRIVYLLLTAAVAGALLAARGWPGLAAVATLLVAGTLSAGGASALNEYIERDRDALMRRTSKRPLVTGQFSRTGWLPWVAGAMILLPSLILAPFNLALPFFLLLGAFIYVVIYTLWLKPRSVLNIVIGGASGSCAVLSGSAAAGHWDAPGALLLAALIFLWTPIHFWSLALVYREDYARAGVPMLPVRATPRRAALWGLAHGIGAGVCGLALAPELGPLFAVPAALITAVLWWFGARLVIESSIPAAWRVFHTSNFYLLIILIAAIVATLAKSWPG